MTCWKFPKRSSRTNCALSSLDIIRSGGLNVEPLTETIDRLIDEGCRAHIPIHFGLVATELGSLRSVQCPIEDIPLGQLKDYMLASSACFPALRPRKSTA